MGTRAEERVKILRAKSEISYYLESNFGSDLVKGLCIKQEGDYSCEKCHLYNPCYPDNIIGILLLKEHYLEREKGMSIAGVLSDN